jgi:hydrogenase maturation protease
MRKDEQEKILVLGVGNILLRDEGLGVRTVEYLTERYSVPDRVTMLDGGTGGLALITVIRDYEKIIIVDAVASNSHPGALYRIDGRKLKNSPPLMATAHQLGVRDMLAVAELEGVHPEVVIIGMEPFDISVGLDLSGLVKGKIPEAAAMVVSELGNFGVELEEKTESA